MPAFALVYTDDPLGLATAGDIVLVDVNGPILNKSLVDLLGEDGLVVAASAQLVEGIYTLTCQYQLKSSSLVLPLNADLGTDDYRISAIAAQCSSRTYPSVTVTAIRPGAGSFVSPISGGKAASITITGGFGMVNLFSATCTQPISSSLNVSSAQVAAIAGSSGDVLTDGLALYGWRQKCSIEGYYVSGIDPLAPVGGKVESSGLKASNQGFQTCSVQWSSDIAFA